MENTGFEPVTFRMQSGRSTADLIPLDGIIEGLCKLKSYSDFSFWFLLNAYHNGGTVDLHVKEILLGTYKLGLQCSRR
jgi:hypothetical protein